MSDLQKQSLSNAETLPVQQDNSVVGVFISLFWLLWGNIFVVAMAIKIIQKQTFLSISFYDAFYWTFVILLAITRYCDIRYYRKTTLKGLPATMSHWRKYTAWLFLISVSLWLLAHLLSNLK